MHAHELEPDARRLFDDAMAWLDRLWDPAVQLVREPPGVDGETVSAEHLVRSTAWYALGLLARGDGGCRRRAIGALTTVLDYQVDAPAEPFHGTWRVGPHEPVPGPGARKWVDYDPNWREFVGCTLASVVGSFERDLPAELVDRIDAALARATEGTISRAVKPTYTNIALLSALLRDVVGERAGRADWQASGILLAEGVGERFERIGAFDEYGSPTYYGVDLHALALWRTLAPSTRLSKLGAYLERRLWEDVGARYHPGLANLAGPYDRTYGMDMCRYASGLGLWLRLASGRADSFPDTSVPFAHAWDFGVAPAYALAGTVVPARVARRLRVLTRPRATDVLLGDGRRVTSWLDRGIALGAMAGYRKKVGHQLALATVHWDEDDGAIGWLRIRGGPIGERCAMDIIAGEGTLEISGAERVDAEVFSRRLVEATPDRLACGAFTVEIDGGRCRGLRVGVPATATFDVSAPTLKLRLRRT